MVKRHGAIWAAILLLGVGAGCKRGGACNEEAARQSVIDYLSKRGNLNVAAMNFTVTSLVCREKDADVTVAFTAKGANPGQPMSFPYTLEHQGDHWVVQSKPETGANPHGAAANSHGGAAGAVQPGAALPPGHPPVGGGAPKQ
jgi:hypothetical protein